MGDDLPFVNGVPDGSLKEITTVQVYGVGFLLTNLSELVDETRVASETFPFGRFFFSTHAAVLVGLFEAAMHVVGVQHGQVEISPC